MSRPKIAIVSGNSKLSDLVKQELPDADITAFTQTMSDPLTEEQVRSLSETEILLVGFRAAQVIGKLPKLKWIQTEFAGVDKALQAVMELPREVRAGITVTHNGESFARPVSEYVISQILAVSHGHYKWHDQQKEGVYKKDGHHTRPMSMSSVAILGLGSIGKEVARICKSFGMKVWGMTRTEVKETDKIPDVVEYRLTSGLLELLSECDYIVNILPSTEETRGLLSGDVFSHCENKKAVFINVGRGDVIDEASVLKALRNGWLQHAVLDVFNTEPLPGDSPLWREPGVIITPHIAWGGPAPPHDRAHMFVKQYQRYINNEPLKYIADVDRGY